MIKKLFNWRLAVLERRKNSPSQRALYLSIKEAGQEFGSFLVLAAAGGVLFLFWKFAIQPYWRHWAWGLWLLVIGWIAFRFFRSKACRGFLWAFIKSATPWVGLFVGYYSGWTWFWVVCLCVILNRLFVETVRGAVKEALDERAKAMPSAPPDSEN